MHTNAHIFAKLERVEAGQVLIFEMIKALADEQEIDIVRGLILKSADELGFI